MSLASKARVTRTLPRLAAMITAIVMVAVFTSAAPAAVVTVVMDAATNNGSFTSPDVSPFAIGAPTGWTAGGNTGNQGLQDGGVDGNQLVFWNAPSGANFADILFRNNLYTVAAAGQMIDMSWYIGGNNQPNGWIYGALRLDGSDVANSNFVHAATTTLGGTGSPQALSYTTVAGDIGKQIGVYFNFTSNNGATQLFLDQVEVAVTTVPTPAALPAGLAMIGLAIVRRRRR